jgi:hypothetical protein
MSDYVATPKRPSFTPGARSARHVPLSRAEQATIDRERAQQRLLDYGPQMLAFIEKLKAFRAKWGKFTQEGWLFDRVIRNGRYVSEYDERTLVAAMTRTERKAAERAERAKAAPYLPAGDNDLSDGDVAAAIRFLTHADADRARDANGEGWRAGHSSTGHMCYALLEQDPAAAIALGRTIVNKYSRQLVMGGVL